MNDIVAVTEKPKEGGTSLIQCHMLTTNNYTVWATRMKITLKVHKAIRALELNFDAAFSESVHLSLGFLGPQSCLP